MRRFAVIGHPVAHSLSPLLHNTAFKTLNLDARYESLDIPPENLRNAVGEMLRKDYDGFNVTLPHKESVLGLLDEVAEDAAALGAVNTVVCTNNRLKGHNTDIFGFLKAIDPFRHHFKGKTALVLGAGGGARAVLHVLLYVQPISRVIIINRTLHRAERLARHFATQRTSIEVLPVPRSAYAIEKSTLVVNTTSAGMSPRIDESPVGPVRFRKDQIVVDLIYTPIETTFLKMARAEGATVVGGLEMLLHQGARAFELWTGKQMPMTEVRKAVEERLRGTN